MSKPDDGAVDGDHESAAGSTAIAESQGAEQATANRNSGRTSGDPGGRLGKALKIFAAALAAAATAVGLLYAIDPRIAPCLDATDAAFTGAPVFPATSYVQYERDLGASPSQADRYRTWGSGYEVRYSIHTDGLRSQSLFLYTTLVKINRDGTIHGVVPNEDLTYRLEDIPERCSETEGSALLVQTPLQHRAHYRLILELYRGPTFRERVALTETPTFDG